MLIKHKAVIRSCSWPGVGFTNIMSQLHSIFKMPLSLIPPNNNDINLPDIYNHFWWHITGISAKLQTNQKAFKSIVSATNHTKFWCITRFTWVTSGPGYPVRRLSFAFKLSRALKKPWWKLFSKAMDVLWCILDKLAPDSTPGLMSLDHNDDWLGSLGSDLLICCSYKLYYSQVFL